MAKSFKTDSERNAYFSSLHEVVDVSPFNKLEYINGVLHYNGIVEQDKVFVSRMELMFDSLTKLAALNEVA